MFGREMVRKDKMTTSQENGQWELVGGITFKDYLRK